LESVFSTLESYELDSRIPSDFQNRYVLLR